eukprot:3302077-Rhodomonas_salina.2
MRSQVRLRGPRDPLFFFPRAVRLRWCTGTHLPHRAPGHLSPAFAALFDHGVASGYPGPALLLDFA